MTVIESMTPAAPEIFLLICTCVVLMVDLFLKDEQRGVSFMLAVMSLLATGLLVLQQDARMARFAFNDLYVADSLSSVLKLFICVAVAMVLVYSRAYIRARDLYRGEFFVLVMFAALGMMIMASGAHMLTLYLGLELLSLTLYSAVAMQRDSMKATEAAMKYFVLGALASSMLLYGMSMIYGATGVLQIAEIAHKIGAGEANSMLLVFGLVFVVAGLGFKLGAVPFHMWVPDVYQGAPTALTLLIGSAPKLAAFALVMRLLVEALGAQALLVEWQNMLVILAVLSMAVGNITAIAQTNLKRMLAYSTISHMGFVLLGVLSGTEEGYGGALFYVVVYTLTALAAFGMILLLSRQGFEAEELDDFRGLNRRSPWYAFMMMLVMFSMAGVPPAVGFYAKLSVLQAVVQADMIWLAVVAVLLSLIGAFYYLRLVKVMYFDEPTQGGPIEAGADARLLLSANGLALLLLGLVPGGLMSLCQYAIQLPH